VKWGGVVSVLVAGIWARLIEPATKFEERPEAVRVAAGLL
jgi:hypothetical protein